MEFFKFISHIAYTIKSFGCLLINANKRYFTITKITFNNYSIMLHKKDRRYEKKYKLCKK